MWIFGYFFFWTENGSDVFGYKNEPLRSVINSKQLALRFEDIFVVFGFWSLTGPVVLQSLFGIRIELVAFIWPVSDSPQKKLKMGKSERRRASRQAKQKLTPYQGKKRSVGIFECCDCEKTWRSAYSWANTAQKCCACKLKSHPFRQVRRADTNPFVRTFLMLILILIFHPVSSATTLQQ